MDNASLTSYSAYNASLMPYGWHNESLPYAQPPRRDPLHIVVPITVLYLITFFVSVVGNTVTCTVIAHKRYMHTTTNCYLFSMAVSDLLLLLTGLPFELLTYWRPDRAHALGEAFCVLRGLCAETSTNASILTIVGFTVERYLAVCHPLLQHTLARLSRVLRIVLLTWLVALLCALLPALQFGIRRERDARGQPAEHDVCAVVRVLLPHTFEAATLVFFVAPLLLISGLYARIALKLKRHARRYRSRSGCRRGRSSAGGVIRMLVAVVVAFFICWAPFHAQRLLAIYAPEHPSPTFTSVYQCLNYVSGVLLFVSTCVNPILYHTMSAKFRMSLRDTFGGSCCWPHSRTNEADVKGQHVLCLTPRPPTVGPTCSSRRVRQLCPSSCPELLASSGQVWHRTQEHLGPKTRLAQDPSPEEEDSGLPKNKPGQTVHQR